MAEESKPKAPEKPVVKYEGVEYPLIKDMTEREMFDAERLGGHSIDEMPHYTAGLLLAYFTLRRAGVEMTFDDFIDRSGFEVAEATPPLPAAVASDTESLTDGDLTESAGSLR